MATDDLRKKIIDTNTLIPIGSIVIVLSAAFWLGQVTAFGEETRAKVERIMTKNAANDAKFQNISANLMEIQNQLGKIEGQMQVILQQTK